MGRPPIGSRAMTGAERVAKYRAKHSKPEPITKHVTKTARADTAALAQAKARIAALEADVARLVQENVQLQMESNPRYREMSDRAVAAELGVDRGVVRSARKRLKERDEEMPTEEEAEESQQQDFYYQACHLLGLMDDATRQRFLAAARKSTAARKAARSPSEA
jgi:hypothetical protein